MLLRKFVLSTLILVLTASAASAYTIVMRNGRRVEIPNQFTLTNSTLTYEVSEGIQVTIQLASIDIAATERVNGEPKGSFMQRASIPRIESKTPPVSRAAERSVTNQDLEDYRRKRVENELAYEQRRKELGLPSLEEQRRQSAAIEERTQQRLLSLQSEEQRAEDYWRSRASALRTEMAANQAQIDFVRRRLDEIPLTYSFGAFSTTIPFGTVATPVVSFPFQNLITPNVFAPSIVNGARFTPNIFQTRPSVFSAPVIHPRRFNRFHGGRRFGRFSHGTLLAVPFQSVDYSLERTELIGQLNELEMQRAGLKARWRELEEDARRAGAYPGWLR